MEKILLRLAVVFGIFMSTLTGPAMANTFAGGIPQAVPYTYNGTTYDRYVVISRGSYSICSNTMAFYFSSAEMNSSGWPASTASYSLGVASGGVPALLTPSGDPWLVYSAVNVSGVCSWTGASFEGEYTSQAFYSLRSDLAEAIHDLNFPLYVKNSGHQTLPYTFSSPYGDYGTWSAAGDIFVGAFRNAPAEGFLYNVSDDGDQCVIYVRNETGIPYPACNGDAKDCFDQADNLGFRTGSTPEVGALMAFDTGNGIPSAGHIAIVKTINSATSITVRDSNWSLDEEVQEHTVNPSSYNIIGYIYPQP